MTDHLAAGRGRDTEIAVQEEVAQASSREFGVAGFDVGKFADGRVLIHLKASTVLFARSATIAGVQFFGSADRRVRSCMVLCENYASRAAARQSRAAPPPTSGSRWRQSEI
jgi:hypothetical protein